MLHKLLSFVWLKTNQTKKQKNNQQQKNPTTTTKKTSKQTKEHPPFSSAVCWLVGLFLCFLHLNVLHNCLVDYPFSSFQDQHDIHSFLRKRVDGFSTNSKAK